MQTKLKFGRLINPGYDSGVVEYVDFLMRGLDAVENKKAFLYECINKECGQLILVESVDMLPGSCPTCSLACPYDLASPIPDWRED